MVQWSKNAQFGLKLNRYDLTEGSTAVSLHNTSKDVQLF